MAKPELSETRLIRVIQAVRELFEGRSHAVGTVSLAATPATTTTVPAANCGTTSRVLLTPTNLAAAAEIGAGTAYVSSVALGSFVITHSASASARTMNYAALGG